MTAPVLIGGTWRPSAGESAFDSIQPFNGKVLGRYPVSPWSEVDDALTAGLCAASEIAETSPALIRDMLETLADSILSNQGKVVALAARETALDAERRLAGTELPRTVDQLRQAAVAAVNRRWTRPSISTATRLASMRLPIRGPVFVLGPNNFPLAFNGAAGGDFAAALATGHSVLVKANTGHPGTTRLLAELAHDAAVQAGLPESTVQLVYRLKHEDGTRVVADRRIAATAYTGSKQGGLILKEAADAAGKPIYLEMSSVNPVVVLPGVLGERPEAIAEELSGSLLMSSGQLCTSPGLIFVVDGPGTELFEAALIRNVAAAPTATLLDTTMPHALNMVEAAWSRVGAELLAKGRSSSGDYSSPARLLAVEGTRFVQYSTTLATEAFGNMSLLVKCNNTDQLLRCLDRLDGNLTGTIYFSLDLFDARLYRLVAGILGPKVGRLIANKPPTGVAVDPSMNHGGPFPSTGHPGFTAVGIPASLERFTYLQCFDQVPDGLLPLELQASNPLGLEREVNLEWTRLGFEWGH